MARWLFNSHGDPIAFVSGDKVFSRSGTFIGRFDRNEVWHGRYRGEVVKDDRFLYKQSKASVVRGTPGTPGTPGIPGLPGSRPTISLPAGYRDADLS
jgi:hypothetical protein